MLRTWARSTALAMLVAAPVQAQPGDETVSRIEELASRARTLYEAGDFGQSVAVYLEAYKLQPTAAVLYNVAVIYDRKLQEVDLAIDFYRRYIGSPDAAPDVVQRATARLQELKEQKEARRQADLATLSAPPPEQRPAGGAEAELTPMSGQSVAGYVVLATGLAALAGGAVVGMVAADSADAFNTIDANTDYESRKALQDEASSRALVADVLMGVGAAAAITGLLLVVLDDGPDPAETALRFGPTADGGVGVWLGGSL